MATSVNHKRPREDEAAKGGTSEVDAPKLTPLEREIYHARLEKEGALLFPIVRNDSTDAAVKMLIQVKTVFTQQLPKMPRAYISRLVLDRQHVSLVCTFRGEVVGGITYRPVMSQRMAEIVFCAVSAKHQVQGYGTRIMNQIKEQCKRDNIEGMLTYADNHAVGYFRKQGFKKQVTMKRERWQGFLKDYEGATLMECLVDPTIDYLSTRQVAEQQRKAVVQKVGELERAEAGSSVSASHRNGTSAAAVVGDLSAARDVLRRGWAPPVLEVRYRGEAQTVEQVVKTIYEAVSAHEDAWPFKQAVKHEDAPDYHEIVKNPIDLSMIHERIYRRPCYYVTPDQLLADLYVMFENCRRYNPDTTVFWECATRLEAYTRNRAAELQVERKPRVHD